ncbi:MAG TPA: hypothetical protein VHQ41_03210 [Patescibacteria group bacterium]|jgi:hypothetical protein|nr:hypothetical protein [Patescibacteria group bacterium]
MPSKDRIGATEKFLKGIRSAHRITGDHLNAVVGPCSPIRRKLIPEEPTNERLSREEIDSISQKAAEMREPIDDRTLNRTPDKDLSDYQRKIKDIRARGPVNPASVVLDKPWARG